MSGERNLCPACAEPIEPEAEQCPWCGERPGKELPLAPERPAGILVFAILNAACGLLGLLGTVGVIAAGSIAGPAIPGQVLGSFLIMFACQLALVGIAFGLFRLYGWARWASMGCSALVVVFIALGVAAIAITTMGSGGALPMEMWIPMIAVYGGAALFFFVQLVYMLRKKTGAVFRKAASHRALYGDGRRP